ncbi:MAG: flippase-like domain-containing protein [Defluviitaleaceae bacterium]|nr:flippase-like domain-containing protein [Defluviitaleaceae bacterium]
MIHSITHSISQVTAWSVLLLVALQVVSQLMVNLQWYLIARQAGTGISFADMLRVNCQGALADSVTPGVKFGGEVARAVQLSRVGGCSGEDAAAIVALQKMFSIGGMLAVVLLVLLVLAGLSGGLHRADFRFEAAVPAGVIAAAVLLAGLLLLPRVRRRVRSFGRVLRGHIAGLRGRPGFSAALAALSLAIWMLYPVKMYAVCVQFLPDVGLMSVGAVAFVSYTVAMLPIFPGGLGGFEASMSAMLVSLGFALSDAAVITVIFRFVTFWLVMLLSLVYIGVMRCVVKH